jgi:hypothetical protein
MGLQGQRLQQVGYRVLARRVSRLFVSALFRLCFGLSACALPLKTKLLVAYRFHFLR